MQMTEVFLKLIETLNGAVFVLILLLLLAFWAIYKIARVVEKYEGFENKHKKFDDCLDNIKDSLSELKAKINILYEKNSLTVESHSPISLSKLGGEIAEELNIQEIVDSHWREIKNMIAGQSPVNPYDIQVAASAIAQKCFIDCFSDEERDKMKTYAYRKGLNLFELYPIIGVLARDKYLSDLGYSVEEIDKHDPKKIKK
ncbi:MAG: hypothetical protein PHO48_03685 [Candidatus Gracilibacteria bacterium]|nr:hypothetical protein [Candidatus Gracilibacteria bacterium]MDD5179455.1 hypothetical protein [Candidatus Gracilibacteria bacterium]